MPKATIMNLEELPEVLTIEQVQQLLGISRPKAYELAHMATFPTVRVGRSIRIPRKSLLRWIEKQAGHQQGDSVGA